MPSALSTELKYSLYESSVQCFEADIEFINQEYRRFYHKAPYTLREDFGGTGLLACHWVKQSDKHESWAIDLDTEPQEYGKKHHYSKLSQDEKQRMNYILGNVLSLYDFHPNVIVAFNFSYFIFKERKTLVEYFTSVRKSLSHDGAFFIDLFGGTEAFQELEEEKAHDNHTYYWDCDSYNPITGDVQYYIHFKLHKNQKKYEKIFSYNWRMWTLPELKDCLLDAGFREVVSYWEGDDEDGGGNGEFTPSSDGENCESWVTYLCGLP